MCCYRNILVAVDGSPAGRAAVAHAISLARDQNARLTLVSITPPERGVVGVPQPPSAAPLHRQVLRDATAAVPSDIGLTTIARNGVPAEVLLSVAAEGEHDLVVMGGDRHGRLHDAVFGSVSATVMRRASCPVLIVGVASVDPHVMPVEAREAVRV